MGINVNVSMQDGGGDTWESNQQWVAGVPGGIPSVTTIHTTINAATYGDGTTDATTVINNAIQSAGDTADSSGVRQVVYLPAGTYRITSYINCNRSNVVLRGDGPANTRIKLDASGPCIFWGYFWPSWGTVYSVSGSVAKGASQITLTSGGGDFAAGDIIQIDQLDDTSYVVIGDQTGNDLKRTSAGDGVGGPNSSGGYRSVCQNAKVQSVNGNTLTLELPTNVAFDSDFSPQVWKSATLGALGRHYIGIEDLYITGADNGPIWGMNLAYSWLKNVESDGDPAGVLGTGSQGIHCQLYHSYRCEIRECYIHHQRIIRNASGAYGIRLSAGTSHCLVEDNIVVYQDKPCSFAVSGGGNIFGYNYIDYAIIDISPGWQEMSADSHASFSHSELWEGNWASSNMGVQATHGNSGWMTCFRNYIRGINSDDVAYQFTAGIFLDAKTWYSYIVGNVLCETHPDMTVHGGGPAIYEHTSDNWVKANSVAAYRIGGWSADFDDGTALSTTLRHGNYDYITDSVVNADGEVVALPDSLYLSSKPSFFGSEQWPWVTPSGTTKYYVLPAKARYDAM